MTQAYYNEFDPFAAQWLKNLEREGHIAPGRVDARSILDVKATDVMGARQAHFFAGIGGWPYALRLAGWPDDVPVWSGSCPCTPFSQAGKGLGFADSRHLWPVWFKLIRECRPPILFGEQVASKAGLEWFDLVCADLEGEGYAVGAADLCAASVGAPHIRQRLYWVAIRMADPKLSDRRAHDEHREDGCVGADGGWQEAHGEPGARGEVRGVAYRDGIFGEQRSSLGDGRHSRSVSFQGAGFGRRCDARGVADDDDDGCRVERFGAAENLDASPRHDFDRGGEPGRVGDSHGILAGRHTGAGDCSEGGSLVRSDRDIARAPSESGFWSNLEWIACIDGKTRPVEPGIFPLAHGLPKGLVRGGDRSLAPDANRSAEGRTIRLRGYGNAIVPQVAAEFIRAVMELP